jgi:rhodanese-related sulfurtransferase
MPSLVPDFFIAPRTLWQRFGRAGTPLIVDAVPEDAAVPDVLPTALRLTAADVPAALARRAASGDAADLVAVCCLHGEKRSQVLAAALRAEGVPACVVEGGIAGWQAAGLPLVPHAALARLAPGEAPVFITRRRPKIDRIACPWLVRRFIAPAAKVLYVDPPQVLAGAALTGAVPFDVPDVELSHEEVEGAERTSFDTFLDRFGLAGVAPLATVAGIVRAADLGRFALSPQAAGLAAIAFGLSAATGDDDHAALRHGLVVYDALYAFARDASGETHGWPPAFPPARPTP